MDIKIIECGDEQRHQWDLFVNSHPGGMFGHSFAWREVLSRSYGLTSYYLAAFSADKIVAVLPITKMRKLKGSIIGISVGFSGWGGMLVAKGWQADSILPLFLKDAARLGMRTVEIRSMLGAEDEKQLVEGGESIFRLTLPPHKDDLWKSIGPKVRNQTRKATKSGITVSRDHQNVDTFYKLYSQRMGQLGTPVHSKKFVQGFLEQFSAGCCLINVWLEKEPVGSLVYLNFNGTVNIPFAATLPKFNSMSPNNLLYWEAMEQAIGEGAKYFDMGRSQVGAGTYRFKKQWGAKPYGLDCRVYIDGQQEGGLSTDFYRSDGAQKLVQVWTKLPYPLQLFLGPKIRRFLP